MWMSPEIFTEIECRSMPQLQKQTTFLQEPLSPGLKLTITLRHLATGESYVSLQFAFKMERSTSNHFVPEVGDAIIRTYGDEVVACLTCSEGWLEIEQGFWERWNLFIFHQVSQMRGEQLLQLERLLLLVLLGLEDTDYKFIWFDIATPASRQLDFPLQ